MKTTKKNLITMKKFILPCMLVLSILTATAAQLTNSTLSINDTIIKGDLKTTAITIEEIAIEEVDEPFEFNTADYLPIGFDPYVTFEEKYGIVYETVIEEADETFDFNTKDYLPVGFNLKKSIIDSITEIEIEEADEPFNFNTKKYLPKGFNANKKATINVEL